MSLQNIAEALDKKTISSVELVKKYLNNIEKYDSSVKAYLYVAGEQALKDAEKVDNMRSRGEAPLGAGIPIALKDNILTKDMPTTCSSRMLEGFYSPYEGTLVRLLREAGFIILGKLNMDEFAMGSSGETSYYQKTANPWDLSKVPGGSSSGSAASVAAEMAAVAIGSDTGGSIRQPASFCGVTGYKPSYGLLSRYGVVAYASSLDQLGTLTHSADDAIFMMRKVSKYDPYDPTSYNGSEDVFKKCCAGSMKNVRIGLPKEYITDDLPEYMRVAIASSVEVFSSLGAEIVEISMPHISLGLAVYQIIANAEGASNMSRFDGIEFGYRAQGSGLDDIYCKSRGEGLGAEVKKRILYGTYVLQSGQYKDMYEKATKVRRLIQSNYKKAFEKCDLVIGPSAPTTAYAFGEGHLSPMQMALGDLYTVTLNLFGGCGVSIPCGYSDGLPLGLQLQGDVNNDLMLLKVADAYQKVTEWHTQKPSLIL